MGNRSQRSYSPEFKRGALILISQPDQAVASVVYDLGIICIECLHSPRQRWCFAK